MEDISRKISELLSNPETMEQIRGLTGLLGQTGERNSSVQNSKTENTTMSSMGNIMNPDMLNTVMKVAPLLQSAGNEDDSTRLLRALKPFLSEERGRRVDGAIRLLGFMRIIPLLKNSGMEFFK